MVQKWRTHVLIKPAEFRRWWKLPK